MFNYLYMKQINLKLCHNSGNIKASFIVDKNCLEYLIKSMKITSFNVDP